MIREMSHIIIRHTKRYDIIICPALAKWNKWQLIQMWVIDVFSSHTWRVLIQSSHFAGRYVRKNIMILHWWQCKWQTQILDLYNEFQLCHLLLFAKVKQIMQRGMSVSVLLRINVCTVVFVMQRESVFKSVNNLE